MPDDNNNAARPTAHNQLTSYAVFGNPIAHSLSPAIHAAFAQQTQQPIRYDKACIELPAFESAVHQFFHSGGGGLNITVPFKQRAFAMATELSEAAAKAGAVNTLYYQDGVLYGDNTDGAGLCRDLTNNLRWPVAGKRLLVLGAGGAVRGVLAPLIASSPASLVIANRTHAKAVVLQEQFAADAEQASVALSANNFAELEGDFDIVINGTSASLAGDLPEVSAAIVNHARCYDMVYGSSPTLFLQWAAQQGARSIADGLGMLVEQAAKSFTLWHGVRPQAAPVIDRIRSSL